MKKYTKFLIALSIFLLISMPAISFAALGGLVPCDGSQANPCNFNAFLTLVNRIINFILFELALPIAAIMFVYAGFLLVTAGGEAAHARTKAKKIFFNAVIGLIMAAGAWLIVKTVLSILGWDGAWIGF